MKFPVGAVVFRCVVLRCLAAGARAASVWRRGDFLHANGPGPDRHGWRLNPCGIFRGVPSLAEPSWHGIQDQKLLQAGKFLLLLLSALNLTQTFMACDGA